MHILSLCLGLKIALLHVWLLCFGNIVANDNFGKLLLQAGSFLLNPKSHVNWVALNQLPQPLNLISEMLKLELDIALLLLHNGHDVLGILHSFSLKSDFLVGARVHAKLHEIAMFIYFPCFGGASLELVINCDFLAIHGPPLSLGRFQLLLEFLGLEQVVGDFL